MAETGQCTCRPHSASTLLLSGLLLACWCLAHCPSAARATPLPHHIHTAGRFRATSHLGAADKLRRQAAARAGSSSGSSGMQRPAGDAMQGQVGQPQGHGSGAADSSGHKQQQQQEQQHQRQGSISGSGRKGGASSTPSTTPDARRRLQQSSQAAPIRIYPELQLPDSISEANRTKIIEGITATIRTLQMYLQVRRPVGPNGLLVAPQYYDADLCDQVNQQSQRKGGTLTCGAPGFFPTFNASFPETDVRYPVCGSAMINPAHVMGVRSCDVLSAQGCTVSAAGTRGGVATDMYLYVTSDSTSCGTNVLAYASTCLYEQRTNRPNMAFFNVCPLALVALTAVQMVSTMTHEMLHTLGFSPDLWDPSSGAAGGRSFFISDSGAPLLGSSIAATLPADPSRAPGSRPPTPMIISPTVLREVRSLFGCGTLAGAMLEDQGGAGSAGSHWEYELFQGDIMTAQAPADADWQHLSRLTLALLQDSGWYYGNFTLSPMLEWGRNEGCAFAMQTCSSYLAADAQQPYFCSPSTAGTQCTFNGRSWGPCRQDPIFSRCGMFTTVTSVGTYTPQPICTTVAFAQYGTVGVWRQWLQAGGSACGWSKCAGCRVGSVTDP